jgi:hypothetical protein
VTFGSTYVGYLAGSQSVVLTNAGAATLTVAGISVLDSISSGDYAESNNCPGTLGAGASCTVWITFTPVAAGGRTAFLTILSSASPAPQAVALSGTAASNPPATFNASLNHSTVFIGASICQFWPMPMHDIGIAGQVSAQVLARFPTQVIGQGYQRVVILVGSNDITTGLNVPSELVANLQAMGTMAANAGMEPVFSMLPPLLPPSVPTDETALVGSVDAAIRQMAIANNWLIVDYFTPMVGHPEYFSDGEHPNALGYSVMEAALAATVTR